MALEKELETISSGSIASCEKILRRGHPLCNLQCFALDIVALQVARKIASCSMAFIICAVENHFGSCSFSKKPAGCALNLSDFHIEFYRVVLLVIVNVYVG